MYSKFFTIKTKIISKLNLLTSYLPFQVKAKILLPTLMVAAIAVPAGAIALSHVFQANPSGAVDGTEEVQNIPHATSAMPSPFVDQNFYDCVEAEFKKEFPDETIDPSGLTDTQLAKIKTLTCSGAYKPTEQKISDITGLSSLIGLTKLVIDGNQLASIDLTKNVALTYLQVANNYLNFLDISKNTELTNLYAGYNQLTAIDTTHNPNLTSLEANGNQLTSLDVSQNNNLGSLSVDNNRLVSLTGLNQSIMTYLWVGSNQLTSIDVTKNKNLRDLDVDNNQLTSLDVSQNVGLHLLFAEKNQLSSLDVSKNTTLKNLQVSNNQLDHLDLRKNSELEFLRADDIIVRTNIVGEQVGGNKIFNLITLKFLGNQDYTPNTIPNTDNYTFDETTKKLSVNNLARANGYAQIVGDPNENITYKLQLPKVYKLHYNLNGGTSGAIADTECESMDGGCSVNVTKGAPKRDGFVFLGWSISSTATTAQYQAGDNFALSDPNTEQTLYAVWLAEGPVPLTTYYLSYDANGGAGVPDTQECKSNTGSCNFDISKTTPLNPGYYFLGWSKDSTSKKAEYHPGETFTTSEIKNVLYAVWEQAGPGPTPTPTGTLSWKHGRDHVKGSKDNAVFNIDYPLSDFKELKLNDKTLEKDKDYTITTPAQMASSDNANNNSKNSSYFSVNDNPTSTTITIKGEYLDTLNPNTYNIVASFSQDDINTTINIIKSDSPTPVPVPGTSGDTGTPNTGEGEHQANPAIVTLCILIPLLAAALTFVSYKIFKPKRKSPLEYYTYKG